MVRSLACALACALAAGALYLPALSAEFAWDDLALIAGDPSSLDQWSDAVDAFAGRGAIGRHQAYYRPLLVTSYVADARLFGVQPRAFHRTNVLLHAVNTALLWALLFALLHRRDAASFGALLFAAHPIQAQAVALVTGRNDLLLLAPVVLALLAHGAWVRAAGREKLLLGCLLCGLYACVLWTKETGILLPAVLAGAELLVHRLRGRQLAARAGLMAGMAGVALAYLIVRHALFGAAVAAGGLALAADGLRQATVVLGYYLQHVLVPTGFAATPFHEGLMRAWSPELLRAAALCAALLAGLVIFWRRRPLWAFALLLFVLALAPVSGLAPMRLLILEHRAYVPMVGMTLLAAAVFVEGRRALAAAAAVLILASLALATHRRIPVYHDDLSLWGATVARVPQSAYACYAYGHALARAGRDGEAAEHLRRAVALRPEDEDASLELAQVLWRTRQSGEARAELESLVARAPGNARAWSSLAALHAGNGQREEALRALRRAERLAPEDSVVLGNLGKVLARSDRIEEAIAVYRRLTLLEPSETSHWVRLARLLTRAGAAEEASSAYGRARDLGYAGPPGQGGAPGPGFIAFGVQMAEPSPPDGDEGP